MRIEPFHSFKKEIQQLQVVERYNTEKANAIRTNRLVQSSFYPYAERQTKSSQKPSRCKICAAQIYSLKYLSQPSVLNGSLVVINNSSPYERMKGGFSLRSYIGRMGSRSWFISIGNLGSLGSYFRSETDIFRYEGRFAISISVVGAYAITIILSSAYCQRALKE
jgi:hypothetical protein